MSDSVMTEAEMFNIGSDAKIKIKMDTSSSDQVKIYTPKIYCSSDWPTSATKPMQYYPRDIL